MVIQSKDSKETPAELFRMYAEGLLHAAENTEKNINKLDSKVDGCANDIKDILQRLAVMDATSVFRKEQECAKKEQEEKEDHEGRIQSLETRLAKIETKIITAAFIIGAVLALLQVSINVVFK